ncbi:TPA: lysine--tRNA ligase, partial [Candidatus Woesearchaeota archaeon]|nr:lysine--tRNA ligase [Candidatus Woesearchaeota archaeon]
KKKKWDEKALHDEFYHICKKLNVDVKAFFQSAYKVLINKERGPRLASFVLTLGDRAVQLFENVA